MSEETATIPNELKREEPTTSGNAKPSAKRKHKSSALTKEVKTPNDPLKETKKPPMPVYGKYNILKILKENHCLIADEEQLSQAFPRNKRYDLNDIKAFVNKTAQKSQSITDKNIKSSEFKRATELIKSIETRSPFTDRTLDIPLSLKTITDVFTFEEELVDVRMLYQTLTNLSLGFPTIEMDSATNDFLYGLYKEFLEQVDTPEFQADVKKYRNFFADKQYESNSRADVKHPTEHSDMDLVIKSALNCPTINPLNIPYSLLHKPKDSF